MSFPRWMEPLPDADLMRATDAWAIAQKGIPSLDLMERAGEGLARLVHERAPSARVAVACGKGNNGGDGFVVARWLREWGHEVDVLTVFGVDEMSDDAREMAQRLGGDAPVPFEAGRLSSAHVIVDALMGTGSSGAARAPMDEIIPAINSARAKVVAADIPSGVDASTGEIIGVAVEADTTGTFHRAKPGLFVHPGKGNSGSIHVIDIGIPRGAPGVATTGLIGPGVLRGIPRRTPTSTKFSSGVVHVIGGSRGLTGAPCMTAMGAMRAGAGYVTVCAPRSLELAFTVRLLEAMHTGLPEDDGSLNREAVEPALKAIRKADAVVLGPGMSKESSAQAFAREMYERIDVPLVIDADGLNAMEGCFPEDLPQRRWATVLTPHAGELARLLEVSSKDVEARRLHHAREAARIAQSFVVLKGDDTLVVSPSGRVAISRGNAPALATAGTGDVLSGVIAAMLARGVGAAQAACAGVWLHTRAGQLAGAPHGPDGVIASDVVAALPAALGEG